MKIAQVINNCSHTSIPIEMAELMSNDECVDIISLYDSQERVEEMLGERENHLNNIVGCNAKENLLNGIRKLVRVLIDGKYDIIHTHHTLSAAVVSHYHRKFSAKIVTTIHGNSHSYTNKQNLICAYVIHRVDGIAYNSGTTKNEMYQWQKTRIKKGCKQKIIYNGIDVNRICNADTTYAHEFRTKYCIPEDVILLVQIGRLENVKNPISTLKAFELYLNSSESRKNAFLIFVGDGSQRQQLEEYSHHSSVLKDKVRFTGTISRDDVYSLLHIIDLQIIPSYYEGFCNALFESLSVGNQVAVSNISVFNELINELDGIELFDPHSIDSIARAIDHAFSTPLSFENRRSYICFAQNNFDSNTCMKKYFQLYKEVFE